MKIYYEAKALERAIDTAPRITPSTKSVLKKIIRSAPVADAEPVVHGCWIEYTKVIIPEPYNKWEQAWKCSECGFDDGFVAYNFCPNCGARMDLEESTDA